MKAFVCVYLHGEPSTQAGKLNQEAANTDAHLQLFLNAYSQPDSFWDGGDDPGFFAASKVLKDPLKATWGVCRRDVRSQLSKGDFIIWFCARPDQNKSTVNYYLIGCTTVADTINRFDLWTNSLYQQYRVFFNTLARPSGSELIQHETIHPFHTDWANRSTAPYILFDNNRSLSAVNLNNPTLVATKNAGSWQETWLSGSNPKVAKLENILFGNLQIERRLRTSHPNQPHRHIPLHRAPIFKNQNPASILDFLRQTILPLI